MSTFSRVCSTHTGFNEIVKNAAAGSEGGWKDRLQATQRNLLGEVGKRQVHGRIAKDRSRSTRKYLVFGVLSGFFGVSAVFTAIFLYDYYELLECKSETQAFAALSRVHQAIYMLTVYAYQRILFTFHPEKFKFWSKESIDKRIEIEKATIENFKGLPHKRNTSYKRYFLDQCQADSVGINDCTSLIALSEGTTTEELLGSIVFELLPLTKSSNISSMKAYILSNASLEWEGYSYVAKKSTLKLLSDSLSSLTTNMSKKSVNYVLMVAFVMIFFTIAGLLFLKTRYQVVLQQSQTLIQMIYLLPEELVESNAYAMNFLKRA